MATTHKLNKRNKSIFLKDDKNVDKDFILFHKSFSTIRTAKVLNPNAEIVYEIGDGRIILFADGAYFAHYYTHYFYSEGIYKLLMSDDYDKYKFYVTHTKIPNQNKVKLTINLYIDKEYLLSFYEKNNMPEMISLIVSGKDKKLTIKEKTIQPSKYQINTCLNIDANKLKCEKYISIVPYNYQRNNVYWMENIEKNVDLGINQYDFVDHTGYIKYYIESIDEMLYFDKKGVMYDVSKKEECLHSINLKGGVLCDEVGLGKTLSLVSLILQNPKDDYEYPKKTGKKKKKPRKKKATPKKNKKSDEINNEIDEEDALSDSKEDAPSDSKEDVSSDSKEDVSSDSKEKKKTKHKSKATLVICPNRLCKQWADEIKKYVTDYDVEVLSVLTITQYKKYTLEDYLNADIVLAGYTFMCNARYLDEEESKLRLNDILWHRLIVDEGHELLIDKVLTKQKLRTMQDTLYKFDATYKWVCSGTPLGEPIYGYPGIIKYLSPDYEDKYKQLLCDHSSKFIKKYFRHNSKESIKNEVVIPPVVETTDFLKQTKIERAIYNSAKGNELQMIQLCTHVLISEYDIVLNDELNLDKLQKIMLKHFGEKIKKTEKRVDNIKSSIISAKNGYNRKVNSINEAISDGKEKMEKNVEKFNKKLKDLPEKYGKDEEELKEELEDDDISDKKATSIKNKIKKLNKELNNKIKETKAKITEAKKDYQDLYAEKAQELSDLKETNKVKMEELNEKLTVAKNDLSDLKYKYRVFDEIDEKYEELDKEICPITKCEIEDPVVTICGHYFDKESIEYSLESIGKWCPVCKTAITAKDVYPVVKEESTEDELSSINMYGTKMAHLIKYLNKTIEADDDNRVIVFTQWEKMLKLVGGVLDNNGIKYVTIKGNAHIMASRIRKFKLDKDIKVILLSSDRCSSGSNLTEASHIVLLDTLNQTKNNAKAIEEQAIGRANRIGQKKSVQVKRMIMENTIEHEYYIRNMK